MLSFVASRILTVFALLVFSSGHASSEKDSVRYYLDQSKLHIYTDFFKAEFYLEKAENVAKKSADKNLTADVAYNYGGTYYTLGSYDVAMKKFMQALAIYESTKNKLGISKCLMGQGLVQQGIERNDEAIKLFKRAIILNKEAGDMRLLSKNVLNVGISEEELKAYESAYRSFLSAYKMSISTGELEMQHLSLNKLARIHYFRNNLDSAVYYYKKLISDKNKPNNWELSFAYTGLSEVFLKKGDLKTAEKYGQRGFQMAEEADAKWDVAWSAGILASIYDKTKNYKEAYKFLTINKNYNDSIFDKSKLTQINLMQLANKEAENEKLASLNEVSSQKIKLGRVLVILMVIGITFLVVILSQYKSNSKLKEKLLSELQLKNDDIKKRNNFIKTQNQTLVDLNQTKNRLFSILSHDLKSPIASIQQVLEMLKSDGISNDEMKVISEHLMMQVDSTSRLLNNLLHWSMTQLDGAKTNKEDFFLQDMLEETLGAMFLMIDNKELKVFHIEASTKKKIYADAGHVRVILNNLLSNAIKFTPAKGIIKIKYSEDKSMLHLHIFNSGSEISESKIKEIFLLNNRLISEKGTAMEEGTGLGLLLVKQFLSENDGKLQILNHAGQGTEFIISFQKAK